ncbi:MAG: OB-fold nucleic acid binding domain-containing protein [Aureliella sp.]
MHFTRLGLAAALGTLGLAIALPAGYVLNVATLRAQETQQFAKESTMMKRGKVTSLLKNDRGDVDGLLLDSDVRVHFPPHMGKQITAVVSVGDAVEVEGRPEVKPHGEKVFEISRLVAGDQTIEIEHRRPKPGPKGPRDEPPMKAAGKVVQYGRNPHGDVDGLKLEDGTLVKFPPHQSRQLQDLVAVGDEVSIDGRRHVTPQGDVHLHADQITAHGKTLEREGPKHGPKGPKHGPGAAEEQPTNADLLRELKAIRELLEKRDRS